MIPKSTLGRGNRHKCFKIFDEYCSSLACGRIRTSPTIINNILIIIIINTQHSAHTPAYIFDIGHPCYGQLTPVKIYSGTIRVPIHQVPTCQNKISADQYHMTT